VAASPGGAPPFPQNPPACWRLKSPIRPRVPGAILGKAMAHLVNGVFRGGNWFIKAGQSQETTTFSKPLRMQSYPGAATLGR
jgi:hypothetical protein